MVLSQPEQRAGYQKIAYLAPSKVEDQRPPFLMFTLASIGVFIEVGAVKIAQGVSILGKMRGCPVQNHADALLVHIIYKILEVFGRAKTAGGGIVAGHLVAPGAIKRIFGN